MMSCDDREADVKSNLGSGFKGWWESLSFFGGDFSSSCYKEKLNF